MTRAFRSVVRRTAGMLVAAALSATAAAAQSRPGELAGASIEELLNVRVTTATRTSEGVAEAPARVDVVTAAQIRRRGYRSVADVLADLTDFKVDRASDQDYPTELVVQGTRGASRVVVMLDGVRISSPTNEPLPILANYPVHAARQIEIVYGPASALYGADAFSAVINIISKDASEASGVESSTSIGQYGLWNQTASYGARIGTKGSLLVAGQLYRDAQPDLPKFYPSDYGTLEGQRSGTFNTIFGPMTPSRRPSPDFSIPITAHSLQASLRVGGLQVLLFDNHARVPTAPATTPDNAVYTADAFNRNELSVGAVSFTRVFGAFTSSSTFTASRHELDPESGYWNAYSNMERSYKYAYGRMFKAEEQLSWRARPTLSVTTGGTVEHFFAVPQGADLNAPLQSRDVPGTILGTTIPDELVQLRYVNVGAFGQVQYALTPALALTLGARADHNTRYGFTFNPRAGLVARPASGTSLKMMYGSAFLAPAPYQAYAHYGSFYSDDGGRTYASSFWHVPNPDLRPQEKRTVEVNLLQQFGRYLHVSASGVRSWFTNLLQESDPDQSGGGVFLGWPVDTIQYAVNEGRSVSYGGTFRVEYRRTLDSDRRIDAHASLALADGRVWDDPDSEAGLPLGALAPVQWRFGADIEWHRWSAAPRMSIIGAQRVLALVGEGDAARRRTIAGFTTIDLTIRRARLVDHLDAFVSIENLADTRYRHLNTRAYLKPEELVGAPQNPRRLTVGLGLRLP